MDQRILGERFCTLWAACAGANAEQVWQQVQHHYREPNRYYHTLAHINHCLRELDSARDHIAEFEATEMALWFHDVIYLYGARDNELLSAAYFRDLAAPSMPGAFVERVCQFIVATQHSGVAEDAAIAFIVDIDLSGFGLPWDDYLADSNALRQEAQSVSDDIYYQGKLRFLSELQRWPSLFQTKYFQTRLERNAQSNIDRYTESLRQQGFGESAICRA